MLRPIARRSGSLLQRGSISPAKPQFAKAWASCSASAASAKAANLGSAPKLHAHSSISRGTNLLPSVAAKLVLAGMFSTSAAAITAEKSEALSHSDVLRFWFGEDYNSDDLKMNKLWFEGGDEADEQIKAEFGPTLEKLLDESEGDTHLKSWE